MATRDRHLHTPDLLRGMAALSVCLFHFTGQELPRLQHQPTASLFTWGWLGVEVFFVISGFIIPYVLLRSGYRLAQFGQFMGKRFVRIAPPSYILLGVTIVQCLLLAGYVHPGSNWAEHLSPVAILHNFTYTIPFIHYHWINGIFWTLAIEWQFYVFIGLLFPLIFRNNLSFLISAALLAGIWYLPFARHVGVLHYGSLFLTGGATLLYFDRRIGVRAFLLLLTGLAILTAVQLGIPQALAATVAALLIAFVSLRHPLTAFFGKISYSLYLTHLLAGADLEILLTRVIPPDSPVRQLLLLLLCLAGTIGIAWAYYRLVEAPFIRLSHRLFRRAEQSPKPAVTFLARVPS